MGFYFRRSVKFGPLRLNFSKSGIGVSAGVKGARVSMGPRGTYVHAGTGGFYYKQRIGGSSTGSQNQTTNTNSFNNQWQNVNIHPTQEQYVIQTADVGNLVEASSAALLNQINTTSKQTRFAPIAVLVTIVASIFMLFPIPFIASLVNPNIGDNSSSAAILGLLSLMSASVTFLVGVFFSWKIHKGDNLKRTTPLFYELEQDAQNKFAAVQQACYTLSRASRIWRIQTNQPTWDTKRNAGASSLITRHPVYISRQSPPYIATNVDVWSIKLNDLTLFFMPDYIFVWQGGTYGTVSYNSLSISFSLKNFVEDESVPPDSKVIDYTWRYVNKKGGPDRRFSNNVQIPIAQYGFIQFQSNSGMNIHFHVSNIEVAKYFMESLNSIISNSRGYKEWTHSNRNNTYEQAKQTKKTIDEKVLSAYEMLGLSVGANAEQVVAAYRQMAKMYHPDRLANLAPEFIELAEERMKEINAAYEILKR